MASSTLRNVSLLGMSLVVSLTIGEVVLRAFVHLPTRRVLPEVRYAPHPVRRFTLLPNQEAFSYGAPVRIDGRAFRVTGDVPVPPGECTTVLAVGDSFTFGLGVRDDETWPWQLQKLLAHPSRGSVEVVNAGTISYGVFQELDLLRTQGLATRPRVVIHALYWNDFMNASAPPAGARAVVDSNGYLAWDGLSTPRAGFRRAASVAISSSALLFSVRQAAGLFRQSGDTPRQYRAEYERFLADGLSEQHWRPIQHFYEESKRLAAEHDFALFVAIMPVSDLVRNGAAQSHAYPPAARRMLERLGIPYLDTFALWSGRRESKKYFLPEGADAHLNAEGYRLVAEALASALLKDPGIRDRLRPGRD